MTGKVYQFVMCPIGIKESDVHGEVFVDVATQFGVRNDCSRPIIIKRPATHDEAKFGAWVLDETSIPRYNERVTLTYRSTTTKKKANEWKDILSQYQGITEVEVMLIDDDDNDKYFQNFNR